MKSQIGNDAALDAKIAELFRAVDDDRAFLRQQQAEGHSGMDLARALQQRGQAMVTDRLKAVASATTVGARSGQGAEPAGD